MKKINNIIYSNPKQDVYKRQDGGLHDALFVLCSHRIEKPADTTICFEKGKVYNVGVLISD